MGKLHDARRERRMQAGPFLSPPLLAATLQSGYRVATRQLGPRLWTSHVTRAGELVARRIASNEDEARANHAALCGEFGP